MSERMKRQVMGAALALMFGGCVKVPVQEMRAKQVPVTKVRAAGPEKKCKPTTEEWHRCEPINEPYTEDADPTTDRPQI